MENEKQAIDIPTNIPLLPIRDVVIYPYMILPLFVGRGLSIKAVDEALNKDRLRNPKKTRSIPWAPWPWSSGCSSSRTAG
jgi:ATP-dependent Lon protease